MLFGDLCRLNVSVSERSQTYMVKHCVTSLRVPAAESLDGAHPHSSNA